LITVKFCIGIPNLRKHIGIRHVKKGDLGLTQKREAQEQTQDDLFHAGEGCFFSKEDRKIYALRIIYSSLVENIPHFKCS
jgi:hypothetical protein